MTSDPYPFQGTLASRIIHTPTASLTVFFESTLTPSPFPTPILYSLIEHCTAGRTYTLCQDDLLRIDFKYPTSWGEITGQFQESWETGYKYNYAFSNIPAFGRQYVMAGGRSRDFSESRGSGITDFKGFLNASPREICGSTIATPYCVTVQPNVFFKIQVPEAKYICDPGPGMIFEPVGLIFVNLPENPQINGFIFASPFLSDPLQDELDALLGITADQGATLCDLSSLQAYDQRVKDIVDAFLGNRLEYDSQHNLELLIHLAHSIRFW
jgi:hypothetical protein